MEICPLCAQGVGDDFRLKGNSGALFWRCPKCYLIFRRKEDWPVPGEERSRYLSHKNSAENAGYVRFLLKPFEFARNRLTIQDPVLDYGCGYAPVFVQLLRERGVVCHGYDPFFFPDGKELDKYPTVFSIETVEHFHDTYLEWEKLMGCVALDGHLVIMTDFWEDLSVFPDWYYQNDLTHTSFYHLRTLDYIAETFERQLLFTDEKRLAVFGSQR